MRKPTYLLVSLATGVMLTLALLSAGAAPPEEQDQSSEVPGGQDGFSANQFDSSRSIVANQEASGFIANDHPANLASAFSQAVRNPLTYTPAATVGMASSLDWASSQRYFRQGWLETNPGFTGTGNRYDVPLAAGAGYRRIVVREVVPVLAASLAVNTFSYWLEQKGLGRVARVLRWTSAGAMTAASTRSFRQWNRNQAGRP